MNTETTEMFREILKAIKRDRPDEWLNNQVKTRKNRYATIKVFSRVFSRALKISYISGKFHDLRKTFASRLYFFNGAGVYFMLCFGSY